MIKNGSEGVVDLLYLEGVETNPRSLDTAET
jgi:hypothetical protein